MSERFKFGDGSEMNPFWVYKTMNEAEQCMCYRLARSGLLGWSKRGLAAAHIKFKDVEPLIEEGIVKKASLLQIAKDVVSNGDYLNTMERLESEGGFLAVKSEDKDFIRDFNLAQQIVKEGETQRNSEERFEFTDIGLKDYINCLIWI